MASPTRSPVEAVRHGLIVLASAWQGLWLISEWLGGSPGISVVLASLGWLALVASLRFEQFRNQLVFANMSLLAGSVAYLVFIDTTQLGGGITATTVLTGLIGLLINSRLAFVLIVVTVVVESIGLVSIGRLGVDDAVGVTYAFAIGMGALLARLALIRGALRATEAQQAAAERAIEARAVEQVASDLLASERVVHATVLNTLTALGRGAVSDARITRERAAQAAEVLGTLISGQTVTELHGSLSDELSRQVERLRAADLNVDLARPKRMPPLPREVEKAFSGALDEAATNILRHAQASRVRIRVTSRFKGIEVSIRDDGSGIVSGSDLRIGLKDVIIASIEQVGGSATIRDTSPGTEVVLGWSADTQQATDSAEARSILARFVAPFLLVFWVFATLRVVTTWSAYENPGFNAIAYVIFTGLVIVVAWRAQRTPLRLGLIALVLLGAPLMYQLQKIALPIGDRPEWASEAIAALFIVLIGAGPAWAWPAVIGVWLLIQGDVRVEILAPGFAILLAIGLFAVSFRRNAARAAAADDEFLAIRAKQWASQAVVASIRGRAAIAEAGRAAELLQGIASGAIDPGASNVGSECAAEERLLRVAMRLDPSQYRLHQVLGEVAVECYRRAIVLDVDVAATGAFDSTVEPFRLLIRQLLEIAPPGCVIRVTTQRTVREWILLCVFEGVGITDNVVAPEDMELAYMSDEQLLLVEWKVQDAPSDR